MNNGGTVNVLGTTTVLGGANANNAFVTNNGGTTNFAGPLTISEYGHLAVNPGHRDCGPATGDPSASVRAAKFPSVEQVFDFVDRQAVTADGLRDINISVQQSANTACPA